MLMSKNWECKNTFFPMIIKKNLNETEKTIIEKNTVDNKFFSSFVFYL